MPHAANEYTQCSKGYLQHNPAPALLYTQPFYLPCLHLYTHQIQIEHASRRMPVQTSEQPYNIRTFGMALDLTMWTVPTHSPVFTILRWWRRCLNRKGLAFVLLSLKKVKYAIMCRQIQKLELPPDGLTTCFRWHKPGRVIWRRTEPPVAKVLHY